MECLEVDWKIKNDHISVMHEEAAGPPHPVVQLMAALSECVLHDSLKQITKWQISHGSAYEIIYNRHGWLS